MHGLDVYESVPRNWVTHDPRTISPRSSEDSEGVKRLLQQETGCLFSKQHLITLQVSLLLLSLSFSPQLFSHTINFTSLSIPKSSSFHAKARLVTSLFFYMLSFLSIEKQFIFQHWIQTTLATLYNFINLFFESKVNSEYKFTALFIYTLPLPLLFAQC